MRRFVLGAIVGVVLTVAVFLGADRLTAHSCLPIAETKAVHWLTTSLVAGWVVDGSYNLGSLSIICLHRPLLPLPPSTDTAGGP